jgi:hypothetical protein
MIPLLASATVVPTFITLTSCFFAKKTVHYFQSHQNDIYKRVGAVAVGIIAIASACHFGVIAARLTFFTLLAAKVQYVAFFTSKVGLGALGVTLSAAYVARNS